MFEQSLITFGGDVASAAIPVEHSKAELILVAGGDDAIWPADQFAAALAARRAKSNQPARLVIHPQAGHRVIFPGEAVITETDIRAMGGSQAADRELGEAAWIEIARTLQIGA
jgi:uncharacterized protein